MSAAVNPEVIKKTQEELGKYVKKPPLTEKLLNKPPFRFLHDVINVIVTETGFLNGLYTDDELSSDNIKDKEAKIAFLQKCIDATSIATGESLSVRPSKIVAGHEADKTNAWLQALGRAITQNVDSSQAVEQVLSGKAEKPKKSDKKSDKEKPDKKGEKPKKEVAPNNRSIKDKDPKARNSLPASRNPIKAKDPKAAPAPKPSKAPDPSKNPRNAPNGRPTKPSQDSGSPSKSSRSKDDKEKSSKKEKDGESKRSSKSAKDRSSKEEKDDKSKRKSKGDGSPEKARSSKSRASSRMGHTKESGKENSPPHEKVIDEDILANGHAEEEDMEPTPRLKSARPPSARPEVIGAALDDLDEKPVDEGIDTQEVPPEGPESEVPSQSEDLSKEADGEGMRITPEEGGGVMSAGPESLLQLDSMQLPDSKEEEPPVIPVGENNNIDPAILKAMGQPDNDALANMGEGQLASEAPDSGVGSLESPKNAAKDSEPPDMGLPTRPGPQPMRAVESFGNEDMTDVDNSQEETPQPGEVSIRPRTGRRSARPPSARPAPPKVRERREIPKEELQRPPTSKPVANVILSSNDTTNDDEDENFTVEESKPMLEEDPIQMDPMGASGAAAAAAAAAVGEDGDGAGLLVAQILESKKELEDGRRNAYSPETPGHRRVQIEKSQLSDANRRKEREIIQKDVQKLVGSIQSITRSVNPLAKMLDYLQEDLDSMQKELESWRNENKLLAQTLKREQSLTEQALEPLKNQLAELETAVQDQRDKLSAIKSSILRNNDKISRMVAGINMNI